MKIFVGMMRPEWWEFSNKVEGNLICSCRMALTTMEQIRHHWQMGHFDYEVYEGVKEG